MRDFVASRVIDGRQQIRLHITLHTNGKLILWPYGHTKADIPADMTRADHAAFVSLGRAMARRNGYKPEQSSDLYITDGDQIDWMYGTYRIFSYTWELYPAEHYRVSDFYPPDERIAGAVSNNRSALLYAIDRAGCPWVTTAARTNCGPLYDDFEINRGWVRNPDGTDTATAGAWQIGNPAAVLGRRGEAARDDDLRTVCPRDRARRSVRQQRERPRRRDDHDPLGAGDAAGHDRRAHVPLLLRPRCALIERRLVPDLDRGRRTGRERSSRRRSAPRRTTTPAGWAAASTSMPSPARRFGS